MPCLVWPLTLPYPEAPFDGEIGLPIKSGKADELGAFESTRTHTDATISGTALLILTPEEHLIFQNFYRDDLNDGLIPFDAQWIFLLGYNGYRAKILDYSIEALGQVLKAKLKLLLVPVAHMNSDDPWLGEDEEDDDYDEEEINGPSCTGYATFSGIVGDTPILQNGSSYAGSHTSNTSSTAPWNASSQHRIFGHTNVAATISPSPTQPTLFGSTTYTYSHKASIVPLAIASGATSSGFGVNTIVNPASSDPTDLVHKAYIDNGCALFEFKANLAIRSDGVDAYIDVTVQILGEYGNILYEKAFARHSGNLGAWSIISDSGSVPPGARYIKYIIYFDKNSYGGASTYAFVNNMRMAFNLPLTGP